MFDVIYKFMTRAVDIVFERQGVRRLLILVCYGLPFGILLLDQTWAREGYMMTAPLLFLGFGLLLVDLHAWQDRQEAAKQKVTAIKPKED